MTMQNKKLFLIIGISLIVLVLLSPCIYGALIEILSLPQRFSWRNRTTPLDVQVVRDLCQKFNLTDEDSRCKKGAVVYAPEFFPTIRNDFISSTGETVTFDYVQEKLGKYQYECSPIITERTGAEYFSCNYDLQGDHVFPIGIFYYSNGRLWRLFASTSN